MDPTEPDSVSLMATSREPVPAPVSPLMPADVGALTGIARPSLKMRLGEDVSGLAGRYRVKSQIARSTSSVIYNAHDEDLGREVAIKVVPAAYAADPEHRHRVSREAHVLAMLDHPNIISIYDLDLGSDGRLYFTMRLIVGRSLEAALKHSADAEMRVDTVRAQLALVCGLADALTHAHQHHVVHADVTPANIMLGKFGEVLLLDWSSAALIDGAAGAISEVPTVTIDNVDIRYQSPEQARGEAPTPASDQYGLAAVAFHLLVGRPPLHFDPGQTQQFQKRKHRGELDAMDAREMAKLPKALVEVLTKALSVSPSSRFPNMAAFSEELDQILAKLTEAAPVPPPAHSQAVMFLALVFIWLMVITAAAAWKLGLFT